MPVTYEWYIENHIIHVQGDGAISLDDLQQLSDAMIAIMESGVIADEQQLHVMVDQSRNTAFPRRVQEVLKAMAFLRHRKMGWFILYGNENPLLKFISQIVSQLANIRFRRLDSLGDALEHLRRADLNIPWEEKS